MRRVVDCFFADASLAYFYDPRLSLAKMVRVDLVG